MPAERDTGISIAERISHQLRDDIMEGKLPPGTQLVEVDLTADYGASRNTIREVLHQLGREGLATFIRHKGVVVRRMERKDLREIYAARRALELQAISGSLPLQPALLDKMLTAIDAAERALARKKWRNVGTLSLQVHQHIVAQLGSRLLDEFFLTLCAQLRLVFASEVDESLIQTPDWIERERRIHGLLVEGRRDLAAQALADYLDDSERTLMAVLTRLKQQAK
ncbi:GntR family transcriptional regulator [Achromobacter insolitus]|uniref:GntR family transcriptional regulator n=1 Tax=Achromobacter insolitus TaxID=217204 RepID=UPI000DD124D7|nr:GntR family transcriptional regulator [Achromobacter insolitus]AXA73817.1 GntR family transcriptional regulator [Achromobacter insolitus]